MQLEFTVRVLKVLASNKKKQTNQQSCAQVTGNPVIYYLSHKSVSSFFRSASMSNNYLVFSISMVSWTGGTAILFKWQQPPSQAPPCYCTTVKSTEAADLCGQSTFLSIGHFLAFSVTRMYNY